MIGAYQISVSGNPINKHPPFVTVSYGMSGFYAIVLAWRDEYGGFYEPWSTGYGRYRTREAAEIEALVIAECEELEYRPMSLTGPHL
jgi:hypothetical protein